ncbi:Longin domain [Spatholobus suberectus]|nr:Longin domain [Spatholobus suberectus]
MGHDQNQRSLIYAFVSRGTVILAEYTEFSGNFNSSVQCLQKLPASNNKFTYNCDGHTFNYLVDNGFTYCVVADESIGRQVPVAFLERVKDDFVAKYGGGKAATAAANSLNKEFGSKLKEHMQYCVEHPEEISKLAKVKAQVSEVKGVMMENIEKPLSLYASSLSVPLFCFYSFETEASHSPMLTLYMPYWLYNCSVLVLLKVRYSTFELFYM